LLHSGKVPPFLLNHSARRGTIELDATPVLPRLPRTAVRCLARLAEGWSLVTGKEPYPSTQQTRLSELDWFCRSDRARSELGYAARPVGESLADAFQWYLAQKKVCVRGLNAWWMRPILQNSGQRTADRESPAVVVPVW
jgi:hypothetical protein